MGYDISFLVCSGVLNLFLARGCKGFILRYSLVCARDFLRRFLNIFQNFRGYNDEIAKKVQKAELGPYAYEEHMPVWLREQLETGSTIPKPLRPSSSRKIVPIDMPNNETTRIINILSELCTQDNSVEAVYLCHPGVQYISKTKREGNFCGYRNIQMLISYFLCTETEDHDMFMGKMPSVLVLQQLIEDAWEKGFNSDGRVETGGIKGTRKYIGTPEVCTGRVDSFS